MQVKLSKFSIQPEIQRKSTKLEYSILAGLILMGMGILFITLGGAITLMTGSSKTILPLVRCML